jgi:cytoskeleton protein RodZ
MPSAGKLLQQERLKREVTLSALATETCISSRYLQAIEEDNLKILPGDFFYRSFVKQYAQALRLDEQATGAILAEIEPVGEVDPLPALTLAYQTAQKEGRISGLYRPSTRVAVALLGVVLIGCSGLFAIWHRTHTQEEIAAEPAATDAQPTVPTTAQPAVAANSSRSNHAVPTVAPPAPDQPVEPGKIEVALEAKEKTWVSLSSHGKTVFSGIMNQAQTKNFAVAENAKLMTGNAAGLDIRWNGKPIGPIGSRGQVRTVLLNADTYEILPPRGL